MRRAVLPVLLLAACATPRDPLLEDGGRLPPPRVPGPAASPVLPPARAAAVEEALAEAERRGRTTLADCVRIAAVAREDLLSGEEDRLQAFLRRDQVLAGVLPRLTATATYFGQNTVRSPGSFSTSPNRADLSFQVLQPLFRGLREFHALRQAAHTAGAREAAVAEIRRGLAGSVARAFYGALLARAEIRTLEESLRVDEERLAEMRARVEHGLARRAEALLLDSRRATTQAALVRARTAQEVARVVLDQVVGVPVRGELEPGPAPAGPVPGREEALAEAIRLRPDLRVAGLAADASAEALAGVRAEYWPSLSLKADAYPYRRNFSQFAEDTKWDASLVLEFPLFEGGALRARERTAASELRQALLDRSAAARRIVEEVEEARARASSADELLRAYETTVSVARENLRLLEEEYRQGIGTHLEVLTAQNDLEEAMRNLERQQLQARLDRVDLHLALGRTEIAP